MKLKSWLWPLAVCLTLILAFQAKGSAAVVKVGQGVGNLKFNPPLSAADQQYLGLGKSGEFTLGDLKAPYVLLEILRTSCPYCMAQAPVMNELYQLVQASSLRSKLKFIGVCESNYQSAAKKFKADYNVPFPLIPDPYWEIGNALRIQGTPTMVVLDKSGKVVFVHEGTFDSAGKIFQRLRSLLR